MATVNEAYEVLSDPELRARFDNGDDPNDPSGGAGPGGGEAIHSPTSSNRAVAAGLSGSKVAAR